MGNAHKSKLNIVVFNLKAVYDIAPIKMKFAEDFIKMLEFCIATPDSMKEFYKYFSYAPESSG